MYNVQVHTKPYNVELESSGGGQGAPGLSAYEVWLSEGNTGTVQDYLDSLKGDNGLSAYEVWLQQGNTGNEVDFINSLKGKDGRGQDGASAYEVWLALNNEGTPQEFIDSLRGDKGEPGESAYDMWLTEGNVGTPAEFLDSLKGEDGASAVPVPQSTPPTRPPTYDGEVWADSTQSYNIRTWVGAGDEWVPGVGAYVETVETAYGDLYLTMAGDSLTFNMDAVDTVDLLVPLPSWVATPTGVVSQFVSAYVPEGDWYREVPALINTNTSAETGGNLRLPGSFDTVKVSGTIDLMPGEFFRRMIGYPEEP